MESRPELDSQRPSLLCGADLAALDLAVEALPIFPKWEAGPCGMGTRESLDWNSGGRRPPTPGPDLWVSPASRAGSHKVPRKGWPTLSCPAAVCRGAGRGGGGVKGHSKGRLSPIGQPLSADLVPWGVLDPDAAMPGGEGGELLGHHPLTLFLPSGSMYDGLADNYNNYGTANRSSYYSKFQAGPGSWGYPVRSWFPSKGPGRRGDGGGGAGRGGCSAPCDGTGSLHLATCHRGPQYSLLLGPIDISSRLR